MEQWGQISSGDLVTTTNLSINLGAQQGFVKQTKNPFWVKNADNRVLKGRIKQPDKNVSIAIYINGLLSNSQGSDCCWTIDIDESASDINFEYVGDTAIFSEAFLIEIRLI